jgi:hypothetical protein
MRLAGRCAVFFLVLLFSPWIAATVKAQPCSTFVCSFFTSCSEGNIECRQGNCFCRPFCNNNADCGDGKFCRSTDGLCYSNAPEACDNNGDCLVSGQECIGGRCTERCNARRDCSRSGQLCTGGVCTTCGQDSDCDSVEACASGLCERRPTATPTSSPTPCTNRECNDGNPCNGVETCDGVTCQRGPAPCPTVQFPDRMRCLRGEGARDGCFECQHTRIAQRDVAEGEIVFNGEIPGLTPTPTPMARITPVPTRWPPEPPPGWGGGGRGWRVRGSLTAGLPSLDPTTSRIHVMIADAKGRAVVYQALEGGAWDQKLGRGWTGDAKLGFTFRDKSKAAVVSRLALVPVAGKESHTVEVEGSLDPKLKLDPALAPTFALQIDWKADVSPLLARTRQLKCEPGRVKGEALRCGKAGS